MKPLFRWDGRHVGFRSGDHVYGRDGECFGWIDDDDTVWRTDGSYLGELMHDNYVLRSKRLREGSRRTRRKMDPPRPIAPTDVADRPARMPLVGMDDALAFLEGRAEPDS